MQGGRHSTPILSKHTVTSKGVEEAADVTVLWLVFLWETGGCFRVKNRVAEMAMMALGKG